ncbi:aminotransferase class V-fold PLP-dependent enzyme [Aegicerativicinus sediminis]|uniref:aminotransferase class V-fold PLP-dependent enzyme n=1 Tax=Aegicerativicinus sediminis TaxID=2893202 RepID=UPI001E4EF1A5|nr:aminotransferase class V-fold PLP-dependent enzyme [Aegicerativicinus sediminis]
MLKTITTGLRKASTLFNSNNPETNTQVKKSQLEEYFESFRSKIIGVNDSIDTPFGTKPLVYADWTASGRNFSLIEEKFFHDVYPLVANTHTETSYTGAVMTNGYNKARKIIKQHVNANDEDVLITVGTGMTGAVNKLQRILGLRLPEHFKSQLTIPEEERPIIFVSHMEHHSNQTTWCETIAKVIVVPPDENGLISYDNFKDLLKQYQDHPFKIVSITACSNVTGIKTNYHKIASIAHIYNAFCFVDFACSAPYVEINMHPENEMEQLDGIFFSPHKFLGGPGSSGVLIFNKKFYKNRIPDNPGGGTVLYTNPWGEHDYIEDIETREDGGTPGFLQTIRTAMAIKLKEAMGVRNILNREKEINEIIFENLKSIPNLKLLAGEHENRLGIFSFYIEDVHYNLIVKLLNDRFGIQTRGGCSCAGTYGHYLLNVDRNTSKEIEQKILSGCLKDRPGWIRMSIHPTMRNSEVTYICNSIREVAENAAIWGKNYEYDSSKNDFEFRNYTPKYGQIENWFKF